MGLTRRNTLMMATATALTGLSVRSEELSERAQSEIAAFTRGATPIAGGIDLVLPEVAEDGHKVSLKCAARGAEEVLVVAPFNPVPTLMRARFGGQATPGRLATRVRLAQSQEVLAFARMPDGTLRRTARAVTVIVGGCAPQGG